MKSMQPTKQQQLAPILRVDAVRDSGWQSHAGRRNRWGVKTEIPRFEAVAGRMNEWRLSLPQPLVELLKEPKVEAEANTPLDAPPDDQQ